MKDSKFRRGQIWWMRGYEVHKETVPTRPVLIISADFINSNMANNNITVVPLTTNTERLYIKTNVGLNRHTRERNVIKCGELITVNKNQLVSYESAVDNDVIKSVEKAILITLGLIDGDLSDEEKVLRETEEQEPEIEDSKEEVEETEEFTVKRNGKHIRWDAENEAHFMKTYQDFGAEYTSIMFGISKSVKRPI